MAKRPPIKITDHALIRYLERGIGIDMDRIRREIAAPVAGKAIAALGNCKWPISNGCKAVFRDGSVVTVIKPRRQD